MPDTVLYMGNMIIEGKANHIQQPSKPALQLKRSAKILRQVLKRQSVFLFLSRTITPIQEGCKTYGERVAITILTV